MANNEMRIKIKIDDYKYDKSKIIFKQKDSKAYAGAS